MFGTIGLPEILIILAIGIFIFGGIKLPGILRSLSSGVKGFRKVRDTIRNPMDFEAWMEEEPEKKSTSRQQQQYYGYYQHPQGPGWNQEWQGQQPGYQDTWPQGGPSQGRQPSNRPSKHDEPDSPDHNSGGS
jgi:Sec-independent protein translocase protein TatA